MQGGLHICSISNCDNQCCNAIVFLLLLHLLVIKPHIPFCICFSRYLSGVTDFNSFLTNKSQTCSKRSFGILQRCCTVVTQVVKDINSYTLCPYVLSSNPPLSQYHCSKRSEKKNFYQVSNNAESKDLIQQKPRIIKLICSKCNRNCPLQSNSCNKFHGF